MSKQLLQDKYVINTVVERLIDPDAKDKYNPWPPQWTNGQISDIVYTPNPDARKDLPPMIVEVQHVVDTKFLFRIMSYCYQVFNQFGAVPVVLIFGISRIKSEILIHCKPSRKHPFLLQYRKECWSQTCYLADANSVKLGLNDIPLPPLASLCLFLTGRHRSLNINPFKADPTMQELYKISKKIFSDQIAGDDDDMREECLGICKLVNDQVKEVSTFLRADVPDAILRARTEAHLMTMSSILTNFQKKYQISSPVSSPVLSPSSTSAPSPAPSLSPAPQPDQWNFVADYVNNHKSKNKDNSSREPVPWEAIFRDGQSKGYFSNIKSSNSMRATFYRHRKANPF